MKMFPSPSVILMITQQCNLRCKYCYETKKSFSKMRKDVLKEVLENTNRIIVTGGEPLTNIEMIEEIYNAIDELNITEKRRNSLREFTIITNGTLIEKNIDVIKKHNMNLGISLDGIREAHNTDRIYPNGNGTFDDVMRGIELCEENDIRYGLSPILTRNKIPYLFDSFKLLLEVQLKRLGSFSLVSNHLHNEQMIMVGEEEYSDEDVDMFIQEQKKIFDYIMSIGGEEIIKGWFLKTRLEHFAYDGKIAVDENLEIYPRAFLAARENKEKYKMPNWKNINLFTYINNVKYVDTIGAKPYWNSFDEASNEISSGSPFYQNSKYTILVEEYNRFVKEYVQKEKHTI